MSLAVAALAARCVWARPRRTYGQRTTPASCHCALMRAGLLDQAEGVRVAVVLPVLGLRKAKDREDHAEDPQNQDQKGEDRANAKGHSRQEDAKDVDGDIADHQGDLEVEGFLRLHSREATSVLEYQPDDEGR